MKLNLIIWHDAVSDDDWVDLPSDDLEPHQIVSVGFVVDEDQNRIILAASWDRDREGVSQRLAIPKSWIIKRKTLKCEL